jgi:hypothetical protein
MMMMVGSRRIMLPLALACFFLGLDGVEAYSACCQTCLNYGNTLADCQTQYVQAFSYNPGDQYGQIYQLGSPVSYRSNVCSDCPAGWYRYTNCRCVECANQYTTPCNYDRDNMVDITKCTTDTNWVCMSCVNCEVGKQCSGSGSSKVCATCPAGKYRDTVYSVAQITCLSCKTCNLANRERRTTCGPVYDSACVQCPAGQIVTQSTAGGDYDTCTSCNSGSYPGTFARASDNQCASCTSCQQTHKQVTPCQATADRTCEACPSPQRSSSLNGDCKGCSPGYVWGGTSCTACDQVACGNNQYIKCVQSADLMGSRECPVCEGHDTVTSLQCNPGYGVSTFCRGTGVTAVTCAQCGAGTERPAGTALVSDGTVSIQKCVPCATGKYKVGAGAGVCQSCTNKPDFSEYSAWAVEAGTSTCPW